MKLLFLLLTVVSLSNAQASTAISVVDDYMEQPSVAGTARLKVMFWNVFDAELYAPSGEFDPEKPFALSLTYLRKLDGQKIVDKTIQEIAKQGGIDKAVLDDWNAQLMALIPDVDKGTTITGVQTSSLQTILYRDGQRLGRIDDAEFTRRFFNIWLGEQTSEPQLREELIGLASY